VFTDRVSVTVVPSAGLMRWEDGSTWVTLPSEREEACAKLTATHATPAPPRSSTLRTAGEEPGDRPRPFVT